MDGFGKRYDHRRWILILRSESNPKILHRHIKSAIEHIICIRDGLYDVPSPSIAILIVYVPLRKHRKDSTEGNGERDGNVRATRRTDDSPLVTCQQSNIWRKHKHPNFGHMNDARSMYFEYR